MVIYWWQSECKELRAGAGGQETQVQVLALPLLWVSHFILKGGELSTPL